MDTKETLRSFEDDLSAEAEETRYSAVKALTEGNSIEVLPHLLKAVADSSYRVREEALKGICAFPKDLIFPRLEELLRDQENANLRTAAMEAFPSYGTEATPFLLRLLKDQDGEVRMFSATILAEIGDPSSVEGLIQVLDDPDENVRHIAAEGLGRIGDARAIAPLIDCLKQDFWIQYPAVIALGNIGDPSAAGHLVGLLDDEMLRQAVIEALGKIGDISVIPVLADILSQNDPAVRNDTIASLVNIQRMVKPDGGCLPSIKTALNNGELIDHLLNSLQDPDPEIKKNTIIALGWLEEERAVGSLLTLIQNYELEEYVVGALVSIGEKAIPELIKALRNPDPGIRTALIRSITWIGGRDGVRACIPFLRDEYSDVRYQAVLAMSEGLDLKDVEDALLELLSDPEPEIRYTLVEILGKSRSGSLVEKILPELSSNYPLRRSLAVRILGRLKDVRACGPLQDLLEEDNDEIRAQVYMALSAIKADQLSLEILIRGISDPSPVVRKSVACSIKTGSREELEGTLIPLLQDPDPDVRIAAIAALGKIGHASCIKDLMTCFDSSNKPLRLAIVQAMGCIHDKKSTRFLTGLLKEQDSELKRMAIDSLGQINDRRSTPDLVIALDDSDWGVRSAAIQSLAKLKDRKCAVHILKRLQDPEDIVKKEAILALGTLGARNTVNDIMALINHENLQSEVIGTLEKLGIPDMDIFRDLFKRSNARLKCRLVDLLSRLRDPGIVDFLMEVLKEEFFTVRCWAVRALGESGLRKAIPSLVKVQKEDPSKEVRKEAGLALKKIKDIR
jgi:HEAT repeat protein